MVALFIGIGIGGATASSDGDSDEQASQIADLEAQLEDAEAVGEEPAEREPEEEEESTTTTEPRSTTTAEPTTTTAPQPDGSRERPLPLGSTTRVDEYDVTVVGFTADGTGAVAAENQFNEPPAPGAVFSLVRVRATYTGDAEGFPGIDLSVGYLGADGIIYDDSSCNAVIPDSLRDQPQVVAGGTVEGNVCVQIPTAVLGTGGIFVEPIFSIGPDEQAWWLEV